MFSIQFHWSSCLKSRASPQRYVWEKYQLYLIHDFLKEMQSVDEVIGEESHDFLPLWSVITFTHVRAMRQQNINYKKISGSWSKKVTTGQSPQWNPKRSSSSRTAQCKVWEELDKQSNYDKQTLESLSSHAWIGLWEPSIRAARCPAAAGRVYRLSSSFWPVCNRFPNLSTVSSLFRHRTACSKATKI